MCCLSNRRTLFEGQSNAACSKYEIWTSGFSLLGLMFFWIVKHQLLAFNDLFGHLLRVKIKTFGSGSANIAIAPRTRKIQLPPGGTNQRFFRFQQPAKICKLPSVFATFKVLFCLFPFRMPINPFSLQLRRPTSSVQQVFQLRNKPAQCCLTCVDI